MMEKQLTPNWWLVAEPNEDREGMAVYIDYRRPGHEDCASLACADNEGETADGKHIPRAVIRAAWNWIDEEDIDY